MPPYRDPYEDDKTLEDEDLGNDYKEGDELPTEDEFESAVTDDEDDVSGDDGSEEDASKEKDDDDEADEVDEEEKEEDGEDNDGDSIREDGDNSAEEGDSDDDDVEDEDDDDDSGEENRVPQTRFNEVNSNWRRAEERAERLENLLEQAIGRISTVDGPDGNDDSEVIEVDVAAVEKEILELAFAGKEEEAVTKRIELDQYKELLWADKYGAGDIEAKVDTMLDTRDEQKNLKEVITSSQDDYPELKEGSKDYDQTLVDEINQIWGGLSSKMPTSVALAKAVELVTATKGMSPVGDKEEEKPAPKPKSKGRKKAAVKKNADAQKRQPPKMRGRSAMDEDLDQVKASKLSDKKLFSMSEKELRILRGD